MPRRKAPYRKRAPRKRPRPRTFRRGYDRTVGLYGRNVEKKYHRTDFSGSTPIGTAIGSVTQLSIIPQGTASDERVGNRVTVTSIHARLKVIWTFGQDETPDTQAIRIVIIQDRQANGTAPVYHSVYSNDPESGGTFNSTLLRNLTQGNRFRVLKDWVVTPRTMTRFVHSTTAALNRLVCPDNNIRCDLNVNIPITYNGPNGTSVEVRDNNIWLLAISDTSANHFMGGTVRIRYTDA